MIFFPAFAQESGVLVLKDGRAVAIRGEYEVFSDEVRFTHSNGEVMVLPLSKVDLEATARRNQQLAGGDLENFAKESQIEKPVIVTAPEPPPEPETPPKFDRTEFVAQLERIQVLLEQVRENPNTGYEELKQEVNQFLDGLPTWTIIGSGVLSLVLMISILVSLGIRLFLVVHALQGSGFGWTLILTITVLVPVFANIIDPGSPLALVALIDLVLIPLYIITHCYGSRLKYLFWWLSPLVAGLSLVFFMAVSFALAG